MIHSMCNYCAAEMPPFIREVAKYNAIKSALWTVTSRHKF